MGDSSSPALSEHPLDHFHSELFAASNPYRHHHSRSVSSQPGDSEGDFDMDFRLDEDVASPSPHPLHTPLPRPSHAIVANHRLGIGLPSRSRSVSRASSVSHSSFPSVPPLSMPQELSIRSTTSHHTPTSPAFSSVHSNDWVTQLTLMQNRLDAAETRVQSLEKELDIEKAMRMQLKYVLAFLM
jgi:hypothetical protein